MDTTVRGWIRNTNGANLDQRNNGNSVSNTGGYGPNADGFFLNNRGASTSFKTIKNDTIISTITSTALGLESSAPFATPGYATGPTTATVNSYGASLFVAGGNMESDIVQLYNSLLAYIS